jgi:ferredoxin-NADP reductase
MQITTLRIAQIRVETFDTKSFVFDILDNGSIDYSPGQFLTILSPDKMNLARRSYSISSSNTIGEPLTITVKRIDNGAFSRYLFDECKVGTVLKTIGASGFFTLPNEIIPGLQFFFFAAGSGITPMIPMIKQLLRHAEIKIHLVYSNKSSASTIFREDLLQLQNYFPESFKVSWLFSDSKHLLQARVSKLYLSEFLKNENVNFASARFYLCGPHDYMQMITISLLSAGIASEHIRKEIFDVAKVVARELPPDTAPHHVTLNLGAITTRFVAQYPETILTAAKREGLTLPYSCEAGKCGTCAATCRSGRVWMYYNEVLVERELNEGRILTCTGYAVGGDVEINFD